VSREGAMEKKQERPKTGKPLKFLFPFIILTSVASYGQRVELPGCRGTIIRYGQSDDTRAVVLTAGHCSGRFLKPGTAISSTTYSDPPDVGSAYVYGSSPCDLSPRACNEAGAWRFPRTRLIYATMTRSDFGLVEISPTYAELKAKNIKTIEVSKVPALSGDTVQMEFEHCRVRNVVYKLPAKPYVFYGSYNLDGCKGWGGYSGMGLIFEGTDKIFGVFNLSVFKDGREIDEQGKKIKVGAAEYGQPIHEIYSCLNQNSEFDSSVPTCPFPKIK